MSAPFKFSRARVAESNESNVFIATTQNKIKSEKATNGSAGQKLPSRIYMALVKENLIYVTCLMVMMIVRTVHEKCSRQNAFCFWCD